MNLISLHMVKMSSLINSVKPSAEGGKSQKRLETQKRLVIISARNLQHEEMAELHRHYDSILLFNADFHSSKQADLLHFDCLLVNINEKRSLSWWMWNADDCNEDCNVVLLLRRGEVFVSDEVMEKYKSKHVLKSVPLECRDREDFERQLMCKHMPSVKSKWRRAINCLLSFFVKL